MTRTLAWDDENRLLKTTDKSGTNENITSYSYDAAGMRALKKGKYGTVQYVSDNYTVRNKDLISKHVFAGNTRLVSKTVMQEEKSGKMTATEQGAYYYHADHLGSSSVVTDKEGKFYEQIEYFPYGETWINNKANSEQSSSPYKFTAKEYDEETGLYYYGARYYDAKLSRWCSADPATSTGEYLPKGNEDNIANLPGIGGVFNTTNLDAYQYGGQNPVKMIDPDGRKLKPGFQNFIYGMIYWGNPKYHETQKENNNKALKWILPIDGMITSPFTESRVRPGTTDVKETHLGIDIYAKEGSKIKAAHKGTIHYGTNYKYDENGELKGGYGNYAYIIDDAGYMTIYGHLSNDQFKDYQKKYDGKTVQAGDDIGLAGSTGYSTGSHLHFEIRHSKNNDPLDGNVDIISPPEKRDNYYDPIQFIEYQNRGQ